METRGAGPAPGTEGREGPEGEARSRGGEPRRRQGSALCRPGQRAGICPVRPGSPLPSFPGLQKNSLQNCFVELLTPSFACQESSLIFNCHKLLRFNCLTLTEVYLVFRLIWKRKF